MAAQSSSTVPRIYRKFAALPSVRRVQGADIEWGLEDQEELWPRRATGGFSAADEVHFVGRYVYSPDLGQFLDGLCTPGTAHSEMNHTTVSCRTSPEIKYQVEQKDE
ncbi:MAG: hypothetical protein Q9185_002809 [Variospora sp. 1 TL-2023]